MSHLRFFGSASIEDASGTALSLASRRHPMVLLALLACAPNRSLSRGKLVGLLWPESGEQTARNRLSTCVHQVRSVLGSDLLQSAGDELRLVPATTSCDVCAFLDAVAAGDHAAAVAHYSGPLLDGFRLDGSAELQDHVDAERDRLADAHAQALEALAEACAAAGQADQAVHWWRRRASVDRHDTRVAMRLAQAIEAAAPARDTAAAASAIAVLPFDNLSGAAEVDPFAAGLHDDLLTELSRVEGLAVIARTSVMCYRGSRRPVQEIARELGVGTLVEGAVQSAGGRLRVNVQLVDARSASHLWAERYDRVLSTDSLFDIQSELVEHIVGSLRAELAPAEVRATAPVARPTADLEAYRLQAQGRQQLVQLTDDSLRKAVACFRGAIERDPGYALAWVGLSDALTARFDYSFDTTPDAIAEAEAAARHALDLQPDMPEAHACHGKLLGIQRRGPAAIAEMRRAVELLPGYGQAHDWLSWTWNCLGRRQEALERARRAVELEPLLLEGVSNLSVSLLANGFPEEAVLEARRVRELAPGWSSGAFYEGLALYRLGRFDAACAVLQGLVVEWVGSGPQGTLALACVGAGDTARARRLLAELEQAGEWFSVGLVHAALGDRDAAFGAFEQVRDWGAYWPTWAVHHYFPELMDRLSGDARYRGMLANIHRAWGLDPDGEFPA